MDSNVDRTDPLIFLAIGDLGKVHKVLAKVGSEVTVWVAPSREAAARLLAPPPAGIDPPISVGDVQIDLENLRITHDNQTIPLTRAEILMLSLLATRPGCLFSFEQITEAVWGCAYLGDSAPVRAAIKRLRKKLSHTTESLIIESVRGSGFRLTVAARDREHVVPTPRSFEYPPGNSNPERSHN